MSKMLNNVIRYLATMYFALFAKVFVGRSEMKVTGTVTNPEIGVTYGIQHRFTKDQHAFSTIMLFYPDSTLDPLAFEDAPEMQENLDVVDFGCVFMDVTSALNPENTATLGLSNVKISISSLTKAAALTLFPNVSRKAVCCADALRVEDNMLVVLDGSQVVYDYSGKVVDVVEE